jgi:hypothetical protein
VQAPPLLREVGEPFLAGIELSERAQALSSLDLGLERDGVLLAVEGTAPIASAVAIADLPPSPVLAL